MTRLLVVDDSPLMRRLMGEVFATVDDFELAYARDGVEALSQLHAFRPDVITLDVQMPEMDGLACLDRIMVERPCPVVMVSSMTEAGARTTLEALELGAVDFVAKPTRAISLEMDELAPVLIEKVRAASGARLPSTRRLAERLRANLRARTGVAPLRRHARKAVPITADPDAPPAPAPGEIGGAVLLGASTGGPPALDAVLGGLADDFPWPVLVAQHMPASFTGPLARRLNSFCALTVLEVTAPMPLAAGHVYVGPGERDLIVARRPTGLIALPAPAKRELRWHPSVDRLVDSAAEHIAPGRLAGVLLTGMGDDGAASMTRLRARGGRTIAEAEETAVVWGMPGALAQAGGAELIAPVDQIARKLTAMVRGLLAAGA